MIKNYGVIFILLISLNFTNTLVINGQNTTSKTIDSLKNIIDTTSNLLTKTDASFKLIQAFQKTNRDSATKHLTQLDSLVRLLNNEDFNIKFLELSGNIKVEMGFPYEGIEYLMQALSLVETRIVNLKGKELYNDHLLLINLNSDLGVAYWHKNDFNRSKELFRTALNHYEIIEKEAPELSDIQIKIKLLNNLGSVYNKMSDYDNALEYYLLALNLYSDPENAIPQLYNNIGICYNEKGQPAKAFHYYLLSLEIAEKKNINSAKISVYNNLGKYYFLHNELEKADEFIKKATDLESIYFSPYSRVVTLELKSLINEKRNNVKAAFDYYKQFISLRDSLENIKSASALSQLEREYQFEKQKRETLLEKERLESEQRQRELVIIIISIIAISASVIFILLFVLQKNKLRRLSLEQENIQIERDTLESELSHKNKELTTNVMYLVRKNELIQKIAEKLLEIKKDLKHSNQDPIQQIIHELQNSLDNDVWKEFEYRFQDVHEEFYQKLNELYPDLSPNEKKLCAFLRLNMSTKEISAITFQTPHSITIARSRLRKKLNITNTDTNLTDFLMSL